MLQAPRQSRRDREAADSRLFPENCTGIRPPMMREVAAVGAVWLRGDAFCGSLGMVAQQEGERRKMAAPHEIVTAGLLVIGDEILSGRTKDKNIGYIAEYLTGIGIDLKEVRVVADDEAAIVEAVNAMRHRWAYVFTTGGIGPTHDDITADSVAKAFGIPIDYDPRAVALLKERYAALGTELNAARMRMTRMPEGAELVANKVSAAPGFWIGNVIVMAGVP